MGEFCHRFKLILWKNYLLRKRQKKRLVIEIIWPLLLFLILLWIRTNGMRIIKPHCHSVPRALPSVSGYELFQNTFCTFFNPCFDYDVAGVDHWNKSVVNSMILSIEPLLTNVTQQNLIYNMFTTLSVWSKNGVPKKGFNTNIINDPDVIQSIAGISKVVTMISGRLGPDLGTGDNFTKLTSMPYEQYMGLFCGNLKELDEARNSILWDGINLLARGSNLAYDRGSTQFLQIAKTTFVKDPDVGETCNDYFKTFYEDPLSTAMWKVLKIFVRGGIYYAPENNFTRSVMDRVHAKLQEMKGMEDNLMRFSKIIEKLQQYLENNRDNIKDTQDWLKEPSNMNEIILQMGTRDFNQKKSLKSMFRQIISSNITTALVDWKIILNHTINFLQCINYDRIKGFKTRRQAEAAAFPLIEQSRIWAVVLFYMDGNGSSSPKNLHYEIRMDSDKVEKTYRTQSRATMKKRPRRNPFSEMKYVNLGLAQIQEIVERAVIEIRTGKSMDGIEVYLQQVPFPCYTDDEYIRYIMNFFPLFMVLSWIYSAAMMIKTIVYEKETQLKEMMKIVGLSNFIHWLGWFVDNFLILFISATLQAMILKFGGILRNSDFFLIWVFLLSYTVSVISFSFLISAFFTHVNSAAAAGGVIFFLTSLPYQLLRLWLEAEIVKWYQVFPVCLLSNAALGFGSHYLGQMEFDGVGAHWDNFYYASADDVIIGLHYCIMILWLDTVIYFLLTLYVETISAGPGISKPWYFLFMPSTYFRKRVVTTPTDENQDTVVGEDVVVEPAPDGLINGVVIRGLSKTYSNGNVGINNLNIEFYQDQITSFLGHNGAGKTTTISLLTGLFPPTKGTATIYGSDITKDMEGARKNIGVCPQYNILFDKLTVSEHIIFFSGLKGKKQRVTETELNMILNDLGIPGKRNEFPISLSGGMKRKLCVAIAFSGDSKTIFLDEPTSGVDPFSRRSIWELLLKYKQGRTIVLTTHFMDEADMLGDRIAIISQGTLKTCGSSLFLKNKFGHGYSLQMVRQLVSKQPELKMTHSDDTSEFRGSSIATLGKGKHLSTKVIDAFVKARIPDAILTSSIGTDISFVLPYASASLFPVLFNDLDLEMYELGISSYGISDTTLEAVFLEVVVLDLYADSVMKPENVFSSWFRCFQKNRKESNKTSAPRSRVYGGSAETYDSEIDGPPETGTAVIMDTVSENSVLFYSPNSSSTGMGSGFGVRSNDTVSDALVINPKPVSGRQQAMNPVLTVSESVESNTDARIGANMKYSASTRVLYCKQIKAIILKRLINSKRSLMSVFFEIVLPTFFVAAALLVITIIPKEINSPRLEMTPYEYPVPLHVFFWEMSPDHNFSNASVSSHIPIGSSYFSRVVDQLVGPIGFGTECLKTRKNHCEPKKFNNKTVENFHLMRKNYRSVQMGSCSCSSGIQVCEKNVERKQPPSFRTHMGSRIFDVSKLDLPEWLQKTYYDEYNVQRVAGYEFDVHKPYRVNITRILILLDHAMDVLLDNETSKTPPNVTLDPPVNLVTIWFNNKYVISPVSYLNAFHNMALRDLLSTSGSMNNRSGITLYVFPFPLQKFQLIQWAYVDETLAVVLAVSIIIALSFVPASFVLYLIQERVCGGKHLHWVSGVKPLIYFVANFLFDMVKFLVPVVIIVSVFAAFDAQAFISRHSILAFIILLILYGWSVIPLMYPASHLFSIPSTAFITLACTNIIIGVITIVSEFLITVLLNEYLANVGVVLKNVFIIFPQYCLGKGITKLVQLHILSEIRKKLSMRHAEPNILDWEILGKYFFALFVQGILFFILNLVVEYRKWIHAKICRPKPRYSCDTFEDEDEDVHRERETVMANRYDPTSVLVTQRLTKFYKKKGKPVVNGITFEIEPGECFGLIGINGAGKTTTFKMLTGEETISGGKILIAGKDPMVDHDRARKHIGYCPQNGGLDLLLTATELLNLYGNLRGMKSSETIWATRALIQFLGLRKYANRKCGDYSGGNKRKLSTGIALIGEPDIIFLDEPTSGMDPAARRQLWKVILLLIHNRKSVVLTTHSMEECEALCTRAVIMANGKFECMGSTQHLKNRFGAGYMLTVLCLEENQKDFFKLMHEKMSYARPESSHFGYIKFKVEQEDAKLSDIFEIMYTARENKLIEEYSVSQITLDDIFVKFASRHKE